MTSSVPRLALAEFLFSFRAADAVRLPAFSDPLRRSVFGLALHELSCVAPDAECGSCALRRHCDFAFLVKGTAPPDAGMLGKVGTIPLPHVFCSSQTGEALIQPGGRFDHGLILVGSACERLPAVVRAMARSGRLGFGAERQKAELVQVVQRLADGRLRLILDGQRFVGQPMLEPCAVPAAPKAVRLEFLTPCVPSGKPLLHDSADVGRLLMTAVRRISLLQYFYMDQQLEADFRQLKAASAGAAILQTSLHRHKSGFWSARQGRQTFFSGFMGTIDLSLERMEELWPFLWLGQKLHLGKQASKGFGRYQLLEL